MKLKPHISQVIKPSWNQKRLLKCDNCGTVFMGVKLLLPVKCPKCGSFKVREDNRAVY
jgi:predicted Zn-ribbon and HTH transcriptional regulator